MREAECVRGPGSVRLGGAGGTGPAAPGRLAGSCRSVVSTTLLITLHSISPSVAVSPGWTLRRCLTIGHPISGLNRTENPAKMDPRWTRFGPVAAHLQCLPKPIRAHGGPCHLPGHDGRAHNRLSRQPGKASHGQPQRQGQRARESPGTLGTARRGRASAKSSSPSSCARAARPAAPSRRW